MDNQLQKDLIKQLNKTLEQARDAYYKKATPIMTDETYDGMEKLLRQYVAETPQFAEYAPVLKTVGSDITSSGRIKHAIPMLSIENQYTFEDVLTWCKKLPANKKIVLEPKFDGISVSLHYRDGQLVQALTRGTGTEGEDITAQVKAVLSIPKTFLTEQTPGVWVRPESIPADLEIRGELVMKNSTLAEINALGGSVSELPDGLEIRPRPLSGGLFETYDDHRLVMAAAVLGLAVPDVVVAGAETVGKTFPGFTDAWASMLAGSGASAE